MDDVRGKPLEGELEGNVLDAARRYSQALIEHAYQVKVRKVLYGSAMRTTQAENDAAAEVGQSLYALQQAACDYDALQ